MPLTNEIISRFEQKIGELIDIFCGFEEDYFFTENDLHSYFYHLCLEDKASITMDHEYSFIHSEYPTPFKCKLLKEAPYLQIESEDSKYRRSHIDMVLINPNFIDWIKKNNLCYQAIKGIKNERFSKYIKDFRDLYSAFSKETNQCILLYALEFKYFRNSFIGTKNPILGIKQDIAKLNALKNLKLNFISGKFVCRSKVLNFISSKNWKLRDIEDEYLQEHSEEFENIFCRAGSR